MFEQRLKGFYTVKERGLVACYSTVIFFSFFSLPFSPQMRTAKINTTIAMWWFRPGFVSTPITKQPVVHPVRVWQTDNQGFWDADNKYSSQGSNVNLQMELEQCYCFAYSRFQLLKEMVFILLCTSRHQTISVTITVQLCLFKKCLL